jgi:hypothetical protein
MHKSLSAGLVALALLTLPAAGQDAPMLNDLSADREGADRIDIEFEFEGGACQEVGPAELGENIDGTLAVTFPTMETAEMCTMQIVEIEVDQTIDADETVSRLDITVLAPSGETFATGSVDVDED